MIEAQIKKLNDTKEANKLKNFKPEPVSANVPFDDFMKLDIRVGKVLECEKVPKADKLLKFKIDDGMGGRTIVSGIAKFYKLKTLWAKRFASLPTLSREAERRGVARHDPLG